MVSLYELEQQYRMLLDDDASTPEDIEAWNGLLDKLGGEIDVKVTNIALVVKQLQAEEKALADEVASLQEKKRTRANKVERLKAYMLEGMTLAGIEKTTDVRAEVRVQKNPPKLEIADDHYIPDEYWVEQEPSVDKRELLTALKDGLEIPGVSMVQEKGIRIK